MSAAKSPPGRRVGSGAKPATPKDVPKSPPATAQSTRIDLRQTQPAVWSEIGRLATAAREDRAVPQALLFMGPEGTGKRNAALLLMRAFNCENSAALTESDPCAESAQPCVSCRLVNALTHPDLLVIEADGDHLKIDQVREALNQIRLSRLGSRRKVVLFLQSNRLMVHAANALLKTLEEPPEHSTIVLTAESTLALPPTVLSRCRVVRFAPLATGHIHRAIESLNLPPENLQRVLQYSHGVPAKAIRYAALFEKGDAMKFLSDFWKALKEGGEPDLSFAQRYEASKNDIEVRIDLLTDALHSAMSRGIQENVNTPYPPGAWVRLVEATLEARRSLAVNANRRLMLEKLLFEARRAVESAQSTS